MKNKLKKIVFIFLLITFPITQSCEDDNKPVVVKEKEKEVIDDNKGEEVIDDQNTLTLNEFVENVKKIVEKRQAELNQIKDILNEAIKPETNASQVNILKNQAEEIYTETIDLGDIKNVKKYDAESEENKILLSEYQELLKKSEALNNLYTEYIGEFEKIYDERKGSDPKYVLENPSEWGAQIMTMDEYKTAFQNPQSAYNYIYFTPVNLEDINIENKNLIPYTVVFGNSYVDTGIIDEETGNNIWGPSNLISIRTDEDRAGDLHFSLRKCIIAEVEGKPGTFKIIKYNPEMGAPEPTEFFDTVFEFKLYKHGESNVIMVGNLGKDIFGETLKGSTTESNKVYLIPQRDENGNIIYSHI